MKLKIPSFLGRFENCLLCLYSFPVNHCNAGTSNWDTGSEVALEGAKCLTM